MSVSETHVQQNDERTIKQRSTSGWTRANALTWYCRDGNVMKKAGQVLNVLRKNLDGRWQLARDANLLM